jgi:PAS domain-containing protein
MNQRAALKIVPGGLDAPGSWKWFCGHCAAPSPGGSAPAPAARVCASCGLGLLLEAREDAVPSSGDAFLVVDSRLLVQAMSRAAQTLLGISEEHAVDKPVAELLVPADAEAQGPTGFAAAIVEAADGLDPELSRSHVRPWNTFGVRIRARIATCGPPRAALIVLDPSGRPTLRAIPGDRVDDPLDRGRLGSVRELRRRR